MIANTSNMKDRSGLGRLFSMSRVMVLNPSTKLITFSNIIGLLLLTPQNQSRKYHLNKIQNGVSWKWRDLLDLVE